MSSFLCYNRFIIQVEVLDKNESASFVLFDKVAFKLLNKIVAELLKQLQDVSQVSSLKSQINIIYILITNTIIT